MEFGETGFADHEQSSPHQRTHAAEKDTKLIDRNGRYGRVSHAGILPKPTGTVLSLTPEISRSLPTGVDPTVVSPAAISITAAPAERSCQGRTAHTGSRAPI